MRNGEGYNDPTVGAAFSNIEKEIRREKRIRNRSAEKLCIMIKQLADFCGFEIVGKLEFKDKATGNIFKGDVK